MWRLCCKREMRATAALQRRDGRAAAHVAVFFFKKEKEMKKKQYTTPTIAVMAAETEHLCITSTEGQTPDGSKTDVPGAGGDGDGEDYAKYFDEW